MSVKVAVTPGAIRLAVGSVLFTSGSDGTRSQQPAIATSASAAPSRVVHQLGDGNGMDELGTGITDEISTVLGRAPLDRQVTQVTLAGCHVLVELPGREDVDLLSHPVDLLSHPVDLLSHPVDPMTQAIDPGLLTH